MKITDQTLETCIKEASEYLSGFLGDQKICAGVVLGSGLNPFADQLEDAQALPYGEIPHFPTSTATGHRGRFVLGRVPGTERFVLCMQGRFHGYEGYTAQEVALPIWCMATCGIDTLVTTNAAGAINPDFAVGEFCAMTDQINFLGRNPLVGKAPNRMAERFVPMKDCFDAELLACARKAAADAGIVLQEGVYLAALGPSFETAAEIRAFGLLGADTVAMSVAEEVIAARHQGMRVYGMSLLTNMACGVAGGDPSSDDIMDAAIACEDGFARFMKAFVQLL